MSNNPVNVSAQPLPDELRALISELETGLVELRRSIHANPETSRAEVKTTECVARELRAVGLEPVLFEGTGLYCDLGPTEHGLLGLRADLDALPLVEENDVPYVSQNPGVAHACGHDVHTTILVGVAKVLAQADRRGMLGRGVRLVFQPAEEAKRGGALDLIEQDVLHGVNAMIALHCDPGLDVGLVGTTVGPITSASDTLHLRLVGIGGHTSRPHLTADVVYALCHVASVLPGVLTRRIDPRGGVSLVWGRINAGSAPNAIPRSGSIEGTLRCLRKEAWEQVTVILPSLIHDLVAPFGVDVEIDHHRGVPPVVNDAHTVGHLVAAGTAELGEHNVVPTEQSLGGEDFAWYLQHVPGALARLGTHTPGGPRKDLHRGDFDVDERAISVGVRLLVGAALHRSSRPH